MSPEVIKLLDQFMSALQTEDWDAALAIIDSGTATLKLINFTHQLFETNVKKSHSDDGETSVFWFLANKLKKLINERTQNSYSSWYKEQENKISMLFEKLIKRCEGISPNKMITTHSSLAAELLCLKQFSALEFLLRKARDANEDLNIAAISSYHLDDLTGPTADRIVAMCFVFSNGNYNTFGHQMGFKLQNLAKQIEEIVNPYNHPKRSRYPSFMGHILPLEMQFRICKELFLDHSLADLPDKVKEHFITKTLDQLVIKKSKLALKLIPTMVVHECSLHAGIVKISGWTAEHKRLFKGEISKMLQEKIEELEEDGLSNYVPIFLKNVKESLFKNVVVNRDLRKDLLQETIDTTFNAFFQKDESKKQPKSNKH